MLKIQMAWIKEREEEVMDKKGRKAEVFIIGLALSLMLCFTACENGAGGGTDELESPIANTAWVSKDDGSYMVFTNETEYAWYQSKEETDDNYFMGTYQFYSGDAALRYITVDLVDYSITEEEMQKIFDENEAYNLENFVCMTMDNESFMLNGEEQLDENSSVSYFGFMLEDNTYLDIANMNTGAYYGFTKEEAQ